MRFILLALFLASGARAQEGSPNEPPVVNDISSSSSPAGVRIDWATDQPSDTQVDYGPTSAYGSSTPPAPAPVVLHAALLPALAPGMLYHYRVKSKNASGALGVSSDYTFEPPAAAPAPAAPLPGAEKIPPSVIIMTPAAGSFASRTVAISANATDNVGVARVQFLLDGAAFAAALTSAPYTFRWDTLTAPDGPHTLAAVASDASGNSATSPVVPVTVDNAPPALSALAAGAAGPNAAVVRWTTNERADSLVEYGTAAAYGFSAKADATVVEHSVGLTGLGPGTAYHYRAASRDQAGNQTVSGDGAFATDAAGGARGPSPAAADDAAVKAPQKLLTPSRADGVNDKAAFGPEAREVSVFDVRGRLVFHAVSPAPAAPLVWDCRDGAGRVVESGIYLASIIKRDGGRLTQSFSIAK